MIRVLLRALCCIFASPFIVYVSALYEIYLRQYHASALSLSLSHSRAVSLSLTHSLDCANDDGRDADQRCRKLLQIVCGPRVRDGLASGNGDAACTRVCVAE